MSFKEYLLQEKIERTDIIDLYILTSMPELEDEANRFIKQEILNKVIHNIEEEAQSVVIREFRYFFEGRDGSKLLWLDEFSPSIKNNSSKLLNKINQEFFRGMYDDNFIELLRGLNKTSSYLDRRFDFLDKYGERLVTLEMLRDKTGLPWTMEIIIDAFNHKKWGWEASYGGPGWQAAAIAVNNLLTSPPSKMLYFLDRLIDFVHNTGPIANKFALYSGGWLNFLLDLKAQSKNVKELIPYASRDVQKMFSDSAWVKFFHEFRSLGAGESNEAIKNILLKTIIQLSKKNYDTSPYLNTFERIFKEKGLENTYQFTIDLVYDKKISPTVAERFIYNLWDAYGSDIPGLIGYVKKVSRDLGFSSPTNW